MNEINIILQTKQGDTLHKDLIVYDNFVPEAVLFRGEVYIYFERIEENNTIFAVYRKGIVHVISSGSNQSDLKPAESV
jgi:hypothetical protein